MHDINLLIEVPAGQPLTTTNHHIYAGADGEQSVDLEFASEPLGLPATEGYGWPVLEFGQALGPDNRFVIARKLGWGGSSSIWLAKDQKYVSAAHDTLIHSSEKINLWRSRPLRDIKLVSCSMALFGSLKLRLSNDLVTFVPSLSET